jgi:phosphotransferase system IIB component
MTIEPIYYYIAFIIIGIIIAIAIVKSRNKNFKIELNKLVEYLGGRDNIIKYEFNKSRFIVDLVDISKVNKEGIQRLGAQGIVEIDNQLKVILGDNVKQFKKYVDGIK